MWYENKLGIPTNLSSLISIWTDTELIQICGFSGGIENKNRIAIESFDTVEKMFEFYTMLKCVIAGMIRSYSDGMWICRHYTNYKMVIEDYNRLKKWVKESDSELMQEHPFYNILKEA